VIENITKISELELLKIKIKIKIKIKTKTIEIRINIENGVKICRLISKIEAAVRVQKKVGRNIIE
jgi:hypothetical protein